MRPLTTLLLLLAASSLSFGQAFITTWKTDNTGTSNDNQITIPTTGSGYNYNVDWGDGSSDTGVTGNITHTYTSPGTYTVSITGDFPRIFFNRDGDRDKILTIQQWGDIEWNSMINAFFGCSNLEVTASDAPNLSGVSSLQNMFQQATSMNADLSHWDVSTITVMTQTFAQMDEFNGNITSWDVSNVTNMLGMFAGSPNFNQPIGNWNVSKVTNMISMFKESNFNQDISNWDVEKVTDFSQMFNDNPEFNQNINSWNVSSGTDMSRMFLKALSFNQPLNDWDVSKVENMNSMFFDAIEFNQPLDNWDVSSVSDMESLFNTARKFNQDITGWDVSNVTSMKLMFGNCLAFNQDLSSWDVGEVTTMDRMFTNAQVFDKNLGSWNVGKVTNMFRMFELSGLSTTNYDNTLEGWATLAGGAGVQNGVDLGAAGINYCNASASRDILTNAPNNWVITDAGENCVVNIPDANFKAALLADGTINTIDDGEITFGEAQAVTGMLNITDQSIENLTGIEAFTNLTDLRAGNNLLIDVDLSSNPDLVTLILSDNDLTSLDLANNSSIATLYVQRNNNLTGLSVSNLIDLNDFDASNTQIDAIDVSNNATLTFISLNSTSITTLDLSSNNDLSSVSLTSASLQSLDLRNGANASIGTLNLTGNPNLTCISVDDVAFAEANFTNIDAQTEFSTNCNAVQIPDANFKAALLANTSINTVDDGEITFEEAEAFTGTMNVSNESILDLTGIEAFINITALLVNNNDIGSIDVSNNIDLQNLQLENCGLSSGIDISTLTELTAFNGRSNGFTSIDLSNNTKLSNLRLEFNELSSLDLSSNTMITQLRVANNPLVALDVSAQPNLTTLYADNTQIAELDVSGNTSLHTLSLINGSLTSLNVANGNNSSFVSFTVRFHPDLSCITVDNVAFSESNWSDPDNSANFSINCSNVETDILTFSIPEQTIAATIDASAHTINLEVPDGTDLTNLTPTFTISSGATVDPVSGVAQDFSSAFVYTITAQNPSVSQEWTVSVAFPKEEQTITFNAIENQFLESETFTLTATASSGLPVAFEVTNGPASVNGNTLTMTATGPVTVRATQPGDATYAAATPVEQSFEIILVTGVPEQRGPQFKFYPNPVDRTLVVVPNGSNNQLSLQDIQGRMVTTQVNNSSDAIQVDVSALPAGIYILKVSNEAGISQAKILKK